MFKRIMRSQPLSYGVSFSLSMRGAALCVSVLALIGCGAAQAGDRALAADPALFAFSSHDAAMALRLGQPERLLPSAAAQRNALNDDDADDEGDEGLSEDKPKRAPDAAEGAGKTGAPAASAGNEKSAAARSKDPAPVSAPTIAEQRNRVLDALFVRLSSARTRAEADAVLGAIEDVWSHSGSDTADLLMKRAILAYAQDNYKLAGELLNKLAVIAPNWSEVWARSAVLRAAEKDDVGAMKDIERALTLEPRHIDMLIAAGNMFETSGDSKNALKMFSRAHDLYPQHDKLKEMVEKLKIQTEGRGI